MHSPANTLEGLFALFTSFKDYVERSFETMKIELYRVEDRFDRIDDRFDQLEAQVQNLHGGSFYEH